MKSSVSSSRRGFGPRFSDRLLVTGIELPASMFEMFGRRVGDYLYGSERVFANSENTVDADCGLLHRKESQVLFLIGLLALPDGGDRVRCVLDILGSGDQLRKWFVTVWRRCVKPSAWKIPSTDLQLVRDEMISSVPLLNRLMMRLSWSNRLQNLITQAGMKTKPGKILLICGVSGLSAYVIAGLFYGRFSVGLLAALAGAPSRF